MTIRYGIATDYDYSAEHKRQRLVVWTGPFYSSYEGEAYSLPNNDGFMVTTYNEHKIRVTCPAPRDQDNYQQVDDAINLALNAHYLGTPIPAVDLETWEPGEDVDADAQIRAELRDYRTKAGWAA